MDDLLRANGTRFTNMVQARSEWRHKVGEFISPKKVQTMLWEDFPVLEEMIYTCVGIALGGLDDTLALDLETMDWSESLERQETVRAMTQNRRVYKWFCHFAREHHSSLSEEEEEEEEEVLPALDTQVTILMSIARVEHDKAVEILNKNQGDLTLSIMELTEGNL